MPNDDYESIIKQTRDILEETNEWKDRYLKYAKEINKNLGFITNVRKTFRERPPLNLYINISSAKAARKAVNFELRYRGQSVAKLTGNETTSPRLTTTQYIEKNMRYFDYDMPFSDIAWDSTKAMEFRKYLRDWKGNYLVRANTKKNREHHIQSLLLTEFSRKENKVIKHIKPVLISRIRFPMPTPITASNHGKIRYAKRGGIGGGIDILARTGTGGPATRLCIIEVKDENTNKEKPEKVMEQALTYTTFIRELLRSKSGPYWWKLFEFGSKIPEHLELYAVCAMPLGQNKTIFPKDPFKIETDTIRLHYIYFNQDNNHKITINPDDTSLTL